MCEVFSRNRCLGCEALSPEYDIDKVKYQCEIYKEEMKEDKQCKNIGQ